MLASNRARPFGLVRALLMGPLLAARYWLLTIAALVVAGLFSGVAYAAVLDSREAEQMTLGTGAAISGSHVILNATGERVTWVDGGAAGGTSVTATARHNGNGTSRVGLALYVNGVNRGSQFWARSVTANAERTWTGLNLSNGDDLEFRAVEVGSREAVLFDRARVDGTPPAADSDGDGVPDSSDRCPGFPDSADADGDGTPDGCDTTQPPQGTIFAGAGDIADVGDADVATGNIIEGLGPGVIAWTAGDNAYENGTLDDFNTKYEPSWGSFKARTWPTPGNHDYRTTNAFGYKSYFDADPLEQATPILEQTYYAQDIGGWRWYFLDSNIAAGTSSGQYLWLQNDLNQNRTACMGAIWHHPVASSGQHGGSAKMRPIFRLLDQSANDVDLVLQGHDHNYERFAKINSTGGASATSGIEAVVVGTGGTALRPFMTPEPGLPTTVKRDATTHGVLVGVLTPSGGNFEFRRADYPTNGSFTDPFSVSCN